MLNGVVVAAMEKFSCGQHVGSFKTCNVKMAVNIWSMMGSCFVTPCLQRLPDPSVAKCLGLQILVNFTACLGVPNLGQIFSYFPGNPPTAGCLYFYTYG